MYNQDLITLNISELIVETSIRSLEHQNIKFTKPEEYLINFLDLSKDELKAVIGFVVEALPSYIYLDKYEEVRNYALLFISRELILFLIQEDKKSQEFQHNMRNFRNEILDEILNNVYIKYPETL